MSQAIPELNRLHAGEQNKYAYFLLAVAASAIALTVQQTQHAGLRWQQIPLAVAVCLWGASFYAGCLNRLSAQRALAINFDIVLMQGNRHPSIDSTGPNWQQVNREWGAENKRGQATGKVQFRCLVGGAVCFLAWHILEMLARTPCV